MPETLAGAGHFNSLSVASQSSGSLATLHGLTHTAADVLYPNLLQDYLETKRRAFPRFYFVAPTDLLDILSKGSNPQLVLRSVKRSCLKSSGMDIVIRKA